MADDSLYERARGLMRTHPGLGKKRLADMLGVRTPTSRKLMHRYRGETQGHSDDPVYQRFRQLKEANPDWGAGRLALELGITRDHADLHLARWRGAQAGLSQGPPPPAGPATASPLAERLEELLGGILERFRAAAPVRPAISRPAGGEGMLEVSLMDTHLGKLAWAPETGRAYNTEIAERMYWTALEDLLARASHLRPKKVLFVVGNDLLHFDTLLGTTTAGTTQDRDVVWKQGFVHARTLMVQAIERLRAVAPVHVAVVNGNHDTMAVFYLGELLAAHFGRTPDVKVDHSPTQRKYVHFGENLIGLTHGNMERERFLGLLMAQEQKSAWAVTRHREWHLGHYHISRRRMYVPRACGSLVMDDTQGIMVRIIPSLASPDSWHASMGYSGKLAAEAYYWDEHDGCVATFTHSPP